jgi:thiol:disulfide interchange protein DsbA
MHSFATDAKVNRGKQFMVRSGVGGTPTIVVDGKYRVLGKSYPDMLRITNQLIAQERAAQEPAAQQ